MTFQQQPAIIQAPRIRIIATLLGAGRAIGIGVVYRRHRPSLVLTFVARAWVLSRVAHSGGLSSWGGIVLAVSWFVRVAYAAVTTPWPTLAAVFALTGIGILILSTEGGR